MATRKETRPRIYGIDWLELYCIERGDRDYTANGFRSRGWLVSEREYGTKTMAEMFTLCTPLGDPFIEVRRAPRGVDDTTKSMVYEKGDCYIKLCNIYCYHENPIGLITQFVARERLTIKKIYRIDLFYDFEIFDSGDKPANVVRRIVEHKYAKINQFQRRTSGADTWTECYDNWLSWGRKKSMVSTKIYDKTKELRETGMRKPWIPELWRRAGYIDNVTEMTLNGKHVQMWRLEFTIKGNAKEWVYIPPEDSEDGREMRVPHSLQLYACPKGVLNAIANLIPHYFHFKIYEPNKRKSRCQDKVLFIFNSTEFESGFRLKNVSDAGRVRNVNVDDDRVALHHLINARMKLWGSRYDAQLQQIISDLDRSINKKCAEIYPSDAELF